MTPGEGLAHSAVPTIAAVILVGGGLIGAALKPTARAWAERWVLMPAGLLFALAMLAYEVMRQNWIWAAIPVALLILLGLRLRTLLRPGAAAQAESDPKGTGTKE
jgi:hypothetical protein